MAVRPAPSKQTHQVLVLGSPQMAARIAEALRGESLEPVVPGWTDEDLRDGDWKTRLKKALEANPGLRFIHPAFSLWAERPELSSIAETLGLQVIAPPVRVLTLFANKLSLILEAEAIGIPNLLIPPAEPLHSIREIQSLVDPDRRGFPFVLKSAKVSTHFGVTVVQNAGDLESRQIPLWIEQLRSQCGEAILFAERYLEGGRQVSVPFVSFPDGRTEVFPSVDGSLQSRHRRIVEFCPAEGIGPDMEEQLEAWVRAFASRTAFVGVGTLDFLIDGDRAFFINGKAALDVSFPFWEKVAGTSAVACQLLAMAGESDAELQTVEPGRRWKSAIAARVYAEDSVLQLPQPGAIQELSTRRTWSLGGEFSGAGAELDFMVVEGGKVPVFAHGLVGIFIAGAPTRSQAIVAARGVLDELWIAGGLQTNEKLISELLLHPWVREGTFHTSFLDEEFLPSLRPPESFSSTFVSVLLELHKIPRDSRWIAMERWIKPTGEPLSWVEGPKLFSNETGISGSIRTEGRTLRVCAFPLSPEQWQVRVGSWTVRVRRVGPAPQASSVKKTRRLNSMISGRIHSVLFRDGASVQAHEPLLIVESLGTLVPHALPLNARVVGWKVTAEEEVHAGQELAEVEII